MIRKSVVIAGMAAGFALLSPVAALAGDHVVDHNLKVSVSGSTVTLQGSCAKPNEQAQGHYGVRNGHEPIGIEAMKANGTKQTLSFKGVKPGKYIAWMFCDSDSAPNGGSISGKLVDFTVGAPKPATETKAPQTKAPQVAEKPKGAPQTGGGAEAADDAGIGTAAAGAAAALAIGGGGFFALRRRASRR
ncbi:hypothetical protein SAMN05421504_1021061 [Amycolatopsis xylanica]|uniref:Gram-positive cocci surface proteins LPxTG domain-containing protein n=2 Tax=Amycolatopsis xylanica TaxID=589385 RepID=A0A1H3AWE1_9PSEU|nr:hypothetical protein SAMN05421504_1021061 [Amycolatopsis xylanica]